MKTGLPESVLLRRIRNDLNELEEESGFPHFEIPCTPEFPLAFEMELHGIPGYSASGTEITDHAFTLYVGKEYPYERPTIKWKTEIFHPNIMAPSEGGRVCVRALDVWDFDSGLLSFIRAVTDLVKNPNPYDPLGSPTCEEAAKWFLSNR